ncbi:sigma-54 interaction domain-containing protein [Alkaliphilus peptidifermentans]|uniref:Arginine utilization regulatory protein n=1 Tax=Alkaliphilus peptidifermentans DSM 18978 TaxID=1120976 RepID=A0A1G5E3C0_9FIRM|nr:sigma 54-interacting transcriptional regulator [Alkaliphilus peptidifermentans]SCY21355.1 arginine utilization regulatory protein [Alkaliphilus peptidifermentans DSM 18978]
MDYKLLLKTILKYKKQSIIVVDSDGTIVYLNDIKGEIFETDPKYAIGKNILDIFGGIDKEESTLYRVLTSKTPIINNIQTFYTYKGNRVKSITTTLPLLINDNIVGAVEILENINDYKKLSKTIILSDHISEPEHNNTVYKSNGTQYTLTDIIGVSKNIEELKKKIHKIADSSSSVLIYGETGTGKELIAQSIHNASFKRRKSPFIAQNCAAIPDTLLESILFGTNIGSFTGAKEKLGLFELADGGTLFLDEINSMNMDLQSKLLRVLQDGIIRRVGSDKTVTVDVRIIASTNVSPIEAVEQGNLRRDLYYRLNVIALTIDPLRTRKKDIDILTQYFIDYYNKLLSREIKGLSMQCKSLLNEYNWPGNVRELKYTIENIVNLIDHNEITEDDLPKHIRTFADKPLLNTSIKPETKEDDDEIKPLNEVLENIERDMIVKALLKSKGNKSKAAEFLKIPRQTLNNKISKYKIKENYEAK